MSRAISHSTPRLAGAAAALAVGLLTLRFVVSTPEEDALREFLVLTGIIAVSTAVVFGLVIPRALEKGRSAHIALTLSVLGLLLAGAFWLGVSPALAVGGIYLAARSDRREGPGLIRAATVVGALALVANVVMLVLDATVA